MRLDRVSWVTAKEYFEKNDIVVIGVGSLECHGSHLALGTDTLAPNKILDYMDDRCDVMIAPTMPYGASDYFMGYPGTVSLGNDILYTVMKRIVDCLYTHGARKFVFLSGHGGNTPALDAICIELSGKKAIGTILNWWVIGGKLNPAWAGGHGAGAETSAMLAIDPKLADMGAIRESVCHDLSENIQSGLTDLTFKGVPVGCRRLVSGFNDNGWWGSDHPSTATAKWGEDMMRAVADWTLEFLEELKTVKL